MRSALLLLLFTLPLLSGCAQPLNNRPTLGGSFLPPTFKPAPPPSIPLDRPAQALFADPPRSRLDWTPRQYISPMDAVVHTPLLQIFEPIRKADPARVYGRYPTPNDALDFQSTKWHKDLALTIDEYGRSLLGLPYALGYFTITGQLNTPIGSPMRPWKRTNTQNTWSSGYPTPPAHNTPTDKEPTDD